MKYTGMIGRVILINFLTILMSCGMPKYSDEEIEEILHNRYKEEFKVEKNAFLFQINAHQFTAHLKRIPEIKIFGEYVEKGSPLSENYPQMLHTYETKLLAQDFLSKYYQDLAVDIEVSSLYQPEEGVKPVDVEKLLSDDNVKVSISFTIYLFQTVNAENAKELLGGIRDFAEHLQQWNNNDYDFLILFWDEGHFKGKNINEIPFGFNVHNEKYYDSTKIKKQYIKQGLAFEFNSDTNSEFSIDELSESIYTYDGWFSWQGKVKKF